MPKRTEAEDFREAGHRLVDWIADYIENPRKHRVLPDMEPGSLVDALPRDAPVQGEPLDGIIADFERWILPAVTHWNHPRFMAYFSVSASGPGILGEMLTAALNTNGMVWKSSPASTELEQVTLSWLRQWLRLPDDFFGIIYDTASVSTFHAIAAAREMAEPGARSTGATPGLVLYTSEHAHSSVEKGAIACGLGQQNVRKIPVDSCFAMLPAALESAIETDVRAGKRPFCVVPTIGTTSTSSIDPVPAIGEIARRYNMWLHVDGAYGASAAVVPEMRWLLDGVEFADSVVVNPHKWLFTPIDLSVFYTRRPEILRRAFSLVPEYLRTQEHPRALNYMDYGVQLGRRFRALKLWFVMRYYGRDAVAEVLRKQMAWAREVGEQMDAHSSFELVAPVPLSLVCFRYKGSDDDNRALLERVNATGKAFLSHTVLNGRYVIRMAIGNMRTTRDDIQEVWSAIQDCAAHLSSG